MATYTALNLAIKTTKTANGYYLTATYKGVKYGQLYKLELNTALDRFRRYVYFLDRGEFWQITGPAWMVS